MCNDDIKNILKRVYTNAYPQAADIEFLLSVKEKESLDIIFSFANNVRRKFISDGVFLRGIIEFSNHCRNNCAYCGLNKSNSTLTRYHMTTEEILDSVAHLAACNIKTVVLQSGEDGNLDRYWLADLIRTIKERFDLAITLCVGERSIADYSLWKKSGADRYLLKIETSDQALYTALHPQMSFAQRMNCLVTLKRLGYQVGSGIIVGLRAQTIATLARDIIFFKKNDFDMVSIGPFIPHSKTELGNDLTGDIRLTLIMIALARIVTKNAHIPATTALGSIERDYRAEALNAGANVLMPNFTPLPYRKFYELYPGKRCLDEEAQLCIGCMQAMVLSQGRYIDYSRGDRAGVVEAKIGSFVNKVV